MNCLILGRGTVFCLLQSIHTLWGPPSSFFKGRRDSFPGSKIAGMKITQFYLVPRLRLSVANTPCMFMVCTGTTLPLPLLYQLSHTNSDLNYMCIALIL